MKNTYERAKLLTEKMFQHFHKINCDEPENEKSFGYHLEPERHLLRLTDMLNTPEQIEWVKSEAMKVTPLHRIIILPPPFPDVLNINILDIGV